MLDPEHVERAFEKIKLRGANYQYFFDHITSPDWIQPLKDKAFFSCPPEPVEEDGLIWFPPWPESQYLARVASQAPELVLQIALEIPETDNARVKEDLIDAAGSMSPHLAVKLAHRAEKWIQKPYLLLPMKVASLVSHLAKGNQAEAALRLARQLLTLMPGRYPSEISDGGEAFPWPADLQPRINVWEYRQFILSNLPDLMRASPRDTLSLLSDVLVETLQLGKYEQAPDFADYSHIWRPAIEPHSQNTNHGDVRNLLVSAVRDTATHLVEQENEVLSEIVDELEARKWAVFKRIALHLVYSFGEANLELVATKLTDRDLFNNGENHHEYSRLAQDYFSKLGQEDRNKILKWIDEGPDLSFYIERVIEEEGGRPTEERLREMKEYWQLRRLVLLKDSLPKQWKRTYESLASKYSEPEHPDLLSWSSGAQWGPRSPKDLDQIEEMSVTELVAFLRSWEQPSGFTMVSPEGLSRGLTKAVSTNPGKYAEEAEVFKGLAPTYIRGVIVGLREATKDEIPFDWGPVLNLCTWIVEQPREILGRGSEEIGDRDPHWGWTRKEVASLLEEALSNKDNGVMPYGFREDVWRILQNLSDDPDPTLVYEERYGGSNMDPATLSINTTRGAAFHAIIAYALWCSNHLRAQQPENEGQLVNLSGMPEVEEVLNLHLDISRDPALSVRAVYGWKFSNLIYLDHQWAISNKQRIFPSNEEQESYWRAAWDAFVQFNQPRATYLDILREDYQVALERLDNQKGSTGWAGDPAERLTEHLMVFYWRGDLDIKSDLIHLYWATAWEDLRAHALTFIGRHLYNAVEEVPEEVLSRLRILWEDRMEHARESESTDPYAQELKSFGWWFASGAFDNTWSLEKLTEVLKLFGEVEANHIVVERLASLAPSYPIQVVALIWAMIEGDRKGWGVHLWRQDAKMLLETVLGSDDQEARRTAEELINLLGARGHIEFRELLR